MTQRNKWDLSKEIETEAYKAALTVAVNSKVRKKVQEIADEIVEDVAEELASHIEVYLQREYEAYHDVGRVRFQFFYNGIEQSLEGET
jgi:hypothetical protein